MRLGGFPQRIACCDRHTNPALREVPIQPLELPRTRDHVEGLHAERASLRGHRLDAVRVTTRPPAVRSRDTAQGHRPRRARAHDQVRSRGELPAVERSLQCSGIQRPAGIAAMSPAAVGVAVGTSRSADAACKEFRRPGPDSADLRGFFILRRSQDLLYVTGHEIQLRRNAGHYKPHAALIRIQQGG